MGALRSIAIAFVFLLVCGVAEAVKTPTNVMVEITFEARSEPSDAVDVLFTEPGGNQLRVPAF